MITHNAAVFSVGLALVVLDAGLPGEFLSRQSRFRLDPPKTLWFTFLVNDDQARELFSQIREIQDRLDSISEMLEDLRFQNRRMRDRVVRISEESVKRDAARAEHDAARAEYMKYLYSLRDFTRDGGKLTSDMIKELRERRPSDPVQP